MEDISQAGRVWIPMETKFGGRVIYQAFMSNFYLFGDWEITVTNMATHGCSSEERII